MGLDQQVIPIYRIQNSSGRGPFQPNLTEIWRDPTHEFPEPPDFEEIARLSQEARTKRLLKHGGFGCRTIEQLREWFWPNERAWLMQLGFFPYRVHTCRPLLEGPADLFFARRWPLKDGTTGVERIDL